MSLAEARTYPLASDRSERFKRSLVCTSSPLRSLRPPRGMARLGAPGWAGENSGHFEHPDVSGVCIPSVIFLRCRMSVPSFPASLLNIRETDLIGI